MSDIGYRVWIDQDLCTGDGICVEIAPALFAMHDDGLAYVKESEWPDIFNGDIPALERTILKHDGVSSLAEKLGVSPGLVSLWMRDKRKISPECCRRIYELMKEDGHPTVTPHELRPDLYSEGETFGVRSPVE